MDLAGFQPEGGLGQASSRGEEPREEKDWRITGNSSHIKLIART